MRDEIGHLALKPDGTPHNGLCHCDRERAHYADEDAPQGDMRVTREQMAQVSMRVVAWYAPGGPGHLEVLRELGQEGSN